MVLPSYVAAAVKALEDRGYEAYVVGGCVRDALLGNVPKDYDLCTSALPEETEAVFAGYPQTDQGRQHGTICVEIQGNILEITTFRTEGGYRDSRHPDWVRFVPDVETDLARRDFTINAMAYSPTRGYVDPFGGREDLKAGVLRTVGKPQVRFREDALRILRCVRFAARYGFSLDRETERAMEAGLFRLDELARERVFEELCGILPTLKAGDVIRFFPVFSQIIPELKPMKDFDQRSPHHAYDLLNHVALVVAKTPPVVALRWAALLHDIGKIPTFTQDETGRGHFYGHAPKSAEMAEAIFHRLRAPAALREEAVFLIAGHMRHWVPEKKELRKTLHQLGWARAEALLCLQQADMASKGIPGEDRAALFRQLRALLEEIRNEDIPLTIKGLAVSGRDLTALGLRGPQVGKTLNALLEAVMEERIVNDREALLRAARQRKEENHE